MQPSDRSKQGQPTLLVSSKSEEHDVNVLLFYEIPGLSFTACLVNPVAFESNPLGQMAPVGFVCFDYQDFDSRRSRQPHTLTRGPTCAPARTIGPIPGLPSGDLHLNRAPLRSIKPIDADLKTSRSVPARTAFRPLCPTEAALNKKAAFAPVRAIAAPLSACYPPEGSHTPPRPKPPDLNEMQTAFNEHGEGDDQPSRRRSGTCPTPLAEGLPQIRRPLAHPCVR